MQGYNYRLDLFEKTVEETDFFYEEFGREASIYDLTKTSKEFLEEIHNKLEEEDFVAPDYIRKRRKGLTVRSEKLDDWKVDGKQPIHSTPSFIAEYLAPYFPVSLYRVVRTKSKNNPMDDELVEEIDKHYNVEGSSNSIEDIIEGINQGIGRRPGYLILSWDKAEEAFNEYTIRTAALRWQGVEPEPLVKMRKCRDCVEKDHPMTRSD